MALARGLAGRALMIRIEFTEEAIDKLRYERFHHPHPRVQRKMEALLLKSEGLPARTGLLYSQNYWKSSSSDGFARISDCTEGSP